MDEKANILLVDDQPAKLLMNESILSKLGENLIMVMSAREALEAARRRRLDARIQPCSHCSQDAV